MGGPPEELLGSVMMGGLGSSVCSERDWLGMANDGLQVLYWTPLHSFSLRSPRLYLCQSRDTCQTFLLYSSISSVRLVVLCRIVGPVCFFPVSDCGKDTVHKTGLTFSLETRSSCSGITTGRRSRAAKLNKHSFKSILLGRFNCL